MPHAASLASATVVSGQDPETGTWLQLVCLEAFPVLKGAPVLVRPCVDDHDRMQVATVSLKPNTDDVRPRRVDAVTMEAHLHRAWQAFPHLLELIEWLVERPRRFENQHPVDLDTRKELGYGIRWPQPSVQLQAVLGQVQTGPEHMSPKDQKVLLATLMALRDLLDCP